MSALMRGLLLHVALVSAATPAATTASPSVGPVVSDLLLEYADIERRTLASLTSLEAASVQDRTISDEINATRLELQGISELTSVMRFILQREEELIVKEAARKEKAAHLSKLQRTLELLRLDNDARARGYLDRLDASIAPTDAAARAFASAKASIRRDLSAWESRQLQAFENVTNASRIGRRAVDESIARLRMELQTAYLTASAAKILVEEAQPANSSGIFASAVATIDGYSPALAALRKSVVSARLELSSTRESLQNEKNAYAQLGLDPLATTNASAVTKETTSAVAGALAFANRNAMQRLAAEVRHLLSLNAARQLNDARRGGRQSGQGSAEASLRSWTQPSSAIEAEIATLEAQRTRLRASRIVLEDELARRAGRAGRLGVVRRRPGQKGPPLPPGAAALLAAAEAAGGIGPGSSPTSVVHAPFIMELLKSNGLSADASAVNLGTGLHGRGSMKGDCVYCTAQRNIGRLLDEIAGLRLDLGDCRKNPSRFKADCGARLQFQIDRLSADVRRRKLVLAAEQVELQNMDSSLSASANACDLSGSTNESANASRVSCSVIERRSIASLRRIITLELEMRLRIAGEIQLKQQYACLWKYHKLPLAEAIAQVIASPADAPTDVSEEAGGALSNLISKARQQSLPRSSDGSFLLAAARMNHTARLLELCAALTAPALASGAGLRSCLCTEVEEMNGILHQTAATAEKRAKAVASANRAASERALMVATKRAAEHEAARNAAKERLFRRLQGRPEFSDLISGAVPSTRRNGTSRAREGSTTMKSRRNRQSTQKRGAGRRKHRNRKSVRREG